METLSLNDIVGNATDREIGYAGIYFLVNEDEIVYVGQSKSVVL